MPRVSCKECAVYILYASIMKVICQDETVLEFCEKIASDLTAVCKDILQVMDDALAQVNTVGSFNRSFKN